MDILYRLFGQPKRPPPRDYLHELIARAEDVTNDAWEEINRSRIRRGEHPIDPQRVFPIGDFVRGKKRHD